MTLGLESETRLRSTPFRKYDLHGAYHWDECDKNSSQYNPPLEARYQVVFRKIKGLRQILDVGCGDGYLMSRVSQVCDQVVGIDCEPTAIKLAREKLEHFSNCKTALASGYEIPFGDGRFDGVVMTDVIEHLENPETCLAEITRVLSPSGVLLLTTPKWRADRRWDLCHVKEFNPSELNTLLRLYFSKVDLSFFWPLSWYKVYATRIGWRLLRLFSRYFYNPFLSEGTNEDHFGQILTLCQCPRR